MGTDGGEPIDLEPIDLEPVDLEPVDPGRRGRRGRRGGPGDEARFDRDRDRAGGGRRTRVWVAVVAAALAVWGVVALTTAGDHTRAVPPTTSVPALVPVLPPGPQLARITTLSPKLWAGLRGIGSGRFAAVVDDRLYLLDRASTEAQATLVPLPEGHVTVDDQNGSSLLAVTLEETLVSTTSTSTRTLSVRDTAIKATEPQQWWLLRSDDTIRSVASGASQPVPAGLRVVAAVFNGFVGIRAPDFGWVLWSGSTIRSIAPPGYQLLAAGPHTVVFKYGCRYGGCSVAIVDVNDGTVRTNEFPYTPEFAAMAPDDSRVALASNQGQIVILDTSTGATVTEDRSVASEDVALPFTWTPDSATLLVVGNHDVKILRGMDGAPMGVINETDGLQQLFALP